MHGSSMLSGYSALDEKNMYKSPDRLRLPLIFYLGHTASVYINKLLLAGLIQVYCSLYLCIWLAPFLEFNKERVNATFESLFELGVDEMSWDDTVSYFVGMHNWHAYNCSNDWRFTCTIIYISVQKIPAKIAQTVIAIVVSGPFVLSEELSQ